MSCGDDLFKIRGVLSWELLKKMREEKVSRNEMAKKLGVSNTVLSRYLNPNYPTLFVDLSDRIATELGSKLTIKLEGNNEI